MKRETKVALVVSGSFLCCVGIYLGLRMRNETPPATESPAEQQAAAQPAPPVEAPLPTPTLAMAPATEPTPTPTPVQPPILTPVADTTVKVPEPVFSPVPAPAPAPMIEPAPQPIQTPTPTPEPVIELPKPEPVKQPEPAPIIPEVKPETPKPIEPLPEFKAVETKQEPPKPVDQPKQPDPLPTPTEFKPIEPAPVIQEEPKPEEPKAGSATLSNEATPPKPLPDPLPNLQPAGGAKPIPKGPVSDSFLEEEYRLQTGDTFAAVSKRFYYSDKYSIALQQYNRDYPIGAANLKMDPPRLTAGTSVWIPPIRVLEKRYPTMIADYKPLPNAVAAGPATAAAPAWSATPARQVAATSKTYRVREGGETMLDIARRTLNNPQAWNTIYQMNPSLNPNANAPIPGGTLLRIPGDARN